MALKNLNTIVKDRSKAKEVKIACDIIDILFDQVANSSKSSNISSTTRIFISEMLLSNKVRNGIKNFVENMKKEELDILINNMKKVLI